MGKSIFTLLCLVVLTLSGAVVARADTIGFSFGPRVGTFSSTTSTTSQGLTFIPSIGPGNVSLGEGSTSSLSLGFFTLNGTQAIYDDAFNLQFNILSPQGTTHMVANFNATVIGQVGTNSGIVTIDFLSNAQAFNFDGPQGSGLFTLMLPDRVITSFDTEIFLPVQINLITFTPVPIPEPTTLLLLGTGLAGMVAKVRKRRKG